MGVLFVGTQTFDQKEENGWGVLQIARGAIAKTRVISPIISKTVARSPIVSALQDAKPLGSDGNPLAFLQ